MPRNWCARRGLEADRCYRFNVDIDQAVRNAIAFAVKSLGPERTAMIRLEEIESSEVDGKPVWLITLSAGTNPLNAHLNRLIGADFDREYKVYTVTKDTGEVLSMKIRLLATLGG
jgi:hypothetical protein